MKCPPPNTLTIVFMLEALFEQSIFGAKCHRLLCVYSVFFQIPSVSPINVLWTIIAIFCICRCLCNKNFRIHLHVSHNVCLSNHCWRQYIVIRRYRNSKLVPHEMAEIKKRLYVQKRGELYFKNVRTSHNAYC